MSADNGIYILKGKDGWRVIHTSAIDNLTWWWTDERLYDETFVQAQKEAGIINPFRNMGESKDDLNPREIAAYFGNSKVYRTREEAITRSVELYDDIMAGELPIIEHGISFIHGWEDKEFPVKYVKI